MRRFSSEGSLLDLDFFSLRNVALKKPECDSQRVSGTYTKRVARDEAPGRTAQEPPTIREPSPCKPATRQLTKEQCASVEDLRDLGKPDKNHLQVCGITEGCRAYSDSQLAPAGIRSTESVERDGLTLSSPSSPSSASHQFQHRHQHRAKLAAAKLHFKSLFVQSPHSSNSNLAAMEHKDSARERRSRLLFMRQWSQVGLGKKRAISREELEKWAESLDSLLASQNGVSVFREFLRSEFSEENLQFYLACEQYRHSSNNFSLQRRAKDICATYIQAGSPREVNLDCKTRDLTIELLQAPSHQSLSHAQRRVYSLLDTDCYPRFLQSSVYLALLEEAD